MEAEAVESGGEKHVHRLRGIPMPTMLVAQPVADLAARGPLLEPLKAHAAENLLVGPPDDRESQGNAATTVRGRLADVIAGIARRVRVRDVERPASYRGLVHEANDSGDMRRPR